MFPFSRVYETSCWNGNQQYALITTHLTRHIFHLSVMYSPTLNHPIIQEIDNSLPISFIIHHSFSCLNLTNSCNKSSSNSSLNQHFFMKRCHFDHGTRSSNSAASRARSVRQSPVCLGSDHGKIGGKTTEKGWKIWKMIWNMIWKIAV